ncbi:MAG: class I SAM-dependent RNA methyltransferase [Deltaproteobacteria bacterium]|nr:class I SAM-dependent RNA methyltransferase [Deltaproteobacteria bacterium]
MYTYRKTHRYFAQIADGLEDAGSREIAALGAREIQPAYRGIYFKADTADLFRINYGARIITRILAPLLTFDCHSPKYLRKTAGSIRWSDFLSPDETFAVFANVSDSRIRHSRYAALCLKDAIADFFRETCGRRPDVETKTPDVWFSLHIHRNRATISLDTSGGSLHRRGYRKASVEAPMQETVAAAIIRMSGWEGERALYDPMCGSGTLITEALMAYCRIPAGFLRKHFGFASLPEFETAAWGKIKAEMDRKIRPLPPGLIFAGDRSKQAVAATRKNLVTLPGHEGVDLRCRDFRKIEEIRNAVLVCNPPYGIRLGKESDLGNFYKEFGDFLKQRCRGTSAYLYFGNREMIKKIGLKPSWKKPLKNGGLEGRLVKYEMY